MTHTHLLKQYVRFFGSYAKALEILAVWEGIKPCARILIFEDDAQKTEAYLRSFPLHVEAADFKVELWQSSTARGYSSKGGVILLSPPGQSPGQEGRKGYYVLYISKNPFLASAAKEAERVQDHARLGLALGYPGCCSRFFAHYATEEQHRHNTFIMPLLAHTRKSQHLNAQTQSPQPPGAYQSYPFQNNVFLRAQDTCLLSHIPCSLDCQKSLEQGRKMMGMLHRYSASVAQEFETLLKKGVLVTEEGTSIILDGVAAAGIARDRSSPFTIASASSPDPFARAVVDHLGRARQFEPLQGQGILVEDRIYPGYHFVRFS